MSKTVLVTGGSGFIGSWVLCELLQQGHRAVVVDVQPAPNRWQRIIGDQCRHLIWADAALTDRDALLRALETNAVTHIIHLAALLTPQCQQDPWRGCHVNVLGSTAVFDAARCYGKVQAISYASSYAVYGPETVATSTDSNRPPMFYGAFKQAVDLITEQYWRHCSLPSVAVRPHVVYGPERDQGLTAGPSLACKAAITGESYNIGYTGLVGYDYVEDVARAFVRAAFECPPGATVVDLESQPATTEDFVREIEALVPTSQGKLSVNGPAIPSNIPPHPNYISTVFSDWQTTSLREGIQRTLAFYQ